jgi:hypothetical protein
VQLLVVHASSSDEQWLSTHAPQPAGTDAPVTIAIWAMGFGQLASAMAPPLLLPLELPPELPPPSPLLFEVASSPGPVFCEPSLPLVDEQANVAAKEPTTTTVHIAALTIDYLLNLQGGAYPAAPPEGISLGSILLPLGR